MLLELKLWLHGIFRASQKYFINYLLNLKRLFISNSVFISLWQEIKPGTEEVFVFNQV